MLPVMEIREGVDKYLCTSPRYVPLSFPSHDKLVSSNELKPYAFTTVSSSRASFFALWSRIKASAKRE